MTASNGKWQSTLRSGLARWCTTVGSCSVHGVHVERLRPSCPLLLLSGATPGPFYHSHPHDPSQFDHLHFDMASQVRANLKTVRDILDALGDAELPFHLDGGCIERSRRHAQLLHWVSNRGQGFAANARVTADISRAACKELGMGLATTLATFETSGNVSDRRFLIETFAMFGLEGAELGQTAETVRVDLVSQFDAVDEESSIYSVGGQRHFMPYVPAYAVCGPADLALFSLSAASGERSAPRSGEEQVHLAIDKLLRVLSTLGATFDGVALLWNRVADLDAHEEAVLMSRARRGLTRPLAEAVLEVADADPNSHAPDGTPLAIEYIVVAQVPRRRAGSD
ncbi:hypothetical protein EMIHUDRAFT_423164 [Emiliania huxleyi CCMP1516]|uniref:Uncharacterized protein n=2 Tax=Emiliania huxleyi TaxID=2903 RepID=A0A0D3KQA1_EMIH1|nr:hypothetical protein EMIHUDRAFT_423164 [Emiliania huxleyi CCMP1516]EOD37936.1 hypothetical protein EMIHUDRAFT_423164 [Emiliania huxleyi CCMP1516]|eukprot:XP_005790365.1 hypothetical protein EMIHUDRAFT_423164 [Emiliania huxleyi CCMP1516]